MICPNNLALYVVRQLVRVDLLKSRFYRFQVMVKPGVKSRKIK
jgi:hypothetical protein